MCTCGALPDHDECSTCAVPPELQNFDDPTPAPRPSLGYSDEEPF